MVSRGFIADLSDIDADRQATLNVLSAFRPASSEIVGQAIFWALPGSK